MLDVKRQTGIPTRYLRNINVRWGQFDLDNLETTLLTPRDVDRLVLVPGDIVACEGGEPGRCAIWLQENSGIAFQKALHRIRIEDPQTVQPEFVALMLEEGIRTGRWDGHFTGTTIRHLPQQQLRQLQIPVPPVAVQASLSAEATDLNARRLRLAGQIATTHTRSEALRRALLAAAFSGRLTGRSSDSELVEELADQEAS
jgi:type I restriction enzyme S subunit